MQTLTIGAYRATLAPTRDVGAFQAKLAKCNGKSRKSAIRDTRTKGKFPKFEAGMSTADYVRLFESWGTPCKPVEWEQLNSEPCTLYSGADTCETLPDGFDTWEDFDAAQGSSTAAESAPADAEPVDAAEPVAPDDAIAPAIVASAAPYPGCEPAAAIVYRVHLATAAHSRAIDPAFNGYRRPRSACMLADFAAPAVRAHRLAIARSVRAERAKRASLEGSEPQRMADAMRARIAPTADALREAAAELEARAARVPTERADDYRGAAAILRADADAAPGIVPGFASRGARMLQAAIARSAARGIEDPNGAPVAAVESDAPPDPEPGAGGAPLATHSQTAPVADPLATHFSTSDNVGRVRYLVSYHDGCKVHSDGSPFYDVATFKNRRARDAFCRDLRARGYTEGAHADPLATHSAADDGGFAHRVATAAAFISSGRNPTRAFTNCLEMYDGAAVAVALMRRAEKRPDSKMAANIWRYLCRSATESSAAEQPAGMSLPEWSRMLVRRAQGESDAMRTAPLPSESDNAAPIECEPVHDVAELDTHERPCAAPGLISYRARGNYGWIMIGAADDADAMREAMRSTHAPTNLQRWDGTAYVPCDHEAATPATHSEPAPLDGLDVAELGDEGMAEFEQATREQATAPAYRELTTAHYRPQGPCLRIPAFDARAMIPQRFAPVYLLQS